MYSPDWDLSAETYFLASALYDTGTADHNMASTSPSFGIHGALLAHALLLEQLHAPKE